MAKRRKKKMKFTKKELAIESRRLELKNFKFIKGRKILK